MAQRVLLAVLLLGAIAIGLAWGWAALLVYVFLVGVIFLLTYALGVGGDWLTEASRGRFVDKNRR